MKTLLIILFYFFVTIKCYSQTDSILEQKYYELYKFASCKMTIDGIEKQLYPTSPFYLVINVTDLKTGISKEICTYYNNIQTAIERIDSNAIIDENRRIFKFKSDSALKDIGYFWHDTIQMKECTKYVTAECLLYDWNRSWIDFTNEYSGDCQMYYAIILFKKGILTRQGSLAGEFYIVTEKDKKEIKEMLER